MSEKQVSLVIIGIVAVVAVVGSIFLFKGGSGDVATSPTGLAFGKPLEENDFCTKEQSSDGYNVRRCCAAMSRLENCTFITTQQGQDIIRYLKCFKVGTQKGSWVASPNLITIGGIDADTGWSSLFITTPEGVVSHCETVEGFDLPGVGTGN